MFGNYHGPNPEQSRQITSAPDPMAARRITGPSTDPTLYPMQILPGQVRFPMAVGVSTFGGQVVVYPGVRAMTPGRMPDQQSRQIDQQGRPIAPQMGYRGFGAVDTDGLGGLGGLIGFGG
jgi:hypothetical protein